MTAFAGGQRKRKPPRRLSIVVNVIGAMTVSGIVLWVGGFTSPEWWQWLTTPKPAPIAKAPVQPPGKPVGIAPIAPKGNDSSVSPIPLRLLLVHVQLGPTPHEGSAQIGVVRESPQTYQAGALLENGARLVEIHPDYVLLQKDGRSTRLYLDGVDAGRAANDALLTVGKAQETTAPAKITSTETVTDYIRPAPLYEGSDLVGFQVYPAARAAVFYQMGLQPGDLITEVDGSPMTDPVMAWEIFHQLAQGGDFTATIKRHDALLSVPLDGSLIVSAEQARTQPVSPAVMANTTP
jgi:general secretion pathway protein C